MKPVYDEHFLARWLAGDLNEEELQEFKNSEAYASYTKIAGNATRLQTPSLNKKEVWSAIQQHKQKQQTKVVTINRRRALQIAATIIVILGLGAVLTLFSTKSTNITTSIAQHTTVNLPDNSLVTVNAESTLRFNKKEWATKREVKLDGEAFFKVEKGSTFDVVTANGTVTVVGTQFNVYTRNGKFKVACFEGKVKVTAASSTTFLTPGEAITITNKTSKAGNFIPTTSPNWVQGESDFDNVTFAEVVAELERQYAITVDVSSVDTTQHFSGAFTHHDLQTALANICKSLQLGYTINNDKVIIYAKK